MPELLTLGGLLAAAAAFLGLALTLRPGKVATDMPRMRLRVASLFTVCWHAGAWANGGAVAFDAGLDLLMSLSLAAVWVWQLETFARWRGMPRFMRLLLQWAGLGVFAISLGWLLLSTRAGWLPVPSYTALALLGVALATFGLVVIEQVYRNAPSEYQPAMRWLGLGIGGVLVIELVALTENILLGLLTVTSDVVRAGGHVLCALAMIRGARLMPRWQLGLSVSRHVVFYASSFLLIGAYLVLLAAAGWVILRYGRGWQVGLELSFLLLAGLGLGLSLFSGASSGG